MKNNIIKFLIFVCSLAIVLPSTVNAVYTDEETGVSVGVRVLASKNGIDWVNFSNSNGEPSGQTLEVNPGDTIYFKGEVWSASESTAYPLLVAYIKNAKYLENIGAFETSEGYDDLDGDGIYYRVSGVNQTEEYVSMYLTFSDFLTYNEPTVGTQSGMIKATVSQDVPKDTTIEGYMVLIYPYYIPEEITPQDAFTDMLDTFPEQAKVKILANKSSVGSVLSATDTLPQTGGSSKGISHINLILGLIFMLVLLGAINFAKYKR